MGTAHFEPSVVTKKVYCDRVPWALCRDIVFCVATGLSHQEHYPACACVAETLGLVLQQNFCVVTGFRVGIGRPGSR